MKLLKLFIIFIMVYSNACAAEQKSNENFVGNLDKIIKQSNNQVYCLNKSSPNKTTSLTVELKEGKRVAMTVCAGCHGVDGIATGAGNSIIIPNILAQNKEYLVARLKDYKSGKIKHDQMSMIAKMLSEKDIVNVASWYSSLQVIIADPKLPAKPY